MSDLISRADAISVLDNFTQTDTLGHTPRQIVEALPSAQPEPCGDAVSREALRKAMYHRAFETDGDTMWQSGCWVRYRAVEQVIKESPSVTPKRKTGKWIDQKGGGCCCSECGRYALDEVDGNFIHVAAKSNYCPNCGADMNSLPEPYKPKENKS